MALRFDIRISAPLGFTILPLLATLSSAEPFECPVTRSDNYRVRNESLEVGVPADGRVVFEPGGPGFIAVSDGALGMKFGWNRLISGELAIRGRRLDGESDPVRAHIPSMGRDIGLQPTSILFPTPGCWEIAGTVANGQLVFVVEVVKIGAGPSWRRDL